MKDRPFFRSLVLCGSLYSATGDTPGCLPTIFAILHIRPYRIP